jgi:hypothetical protein
MKRIAFTGLVLLAARRRIALQPIGSFAGGLAFIQGDSGAPGVAGGDEQAAPASEN